MSYKVDGQSTVGNKTVSTIDELKSLPTQGAGDVFQGQMVIVENIDYAALVGAESGLESNLGPYGSEGSWVGPSSGYVQLNPKHREHLHSNFPVEQQSLVDAEASGTSIGIWFNANRAPSASQHQTLFHIPTLSVGDSNITNQYAPSLNLRGLSLHLAQHPATKKAAILYTFEIKSPYSGTQVQGTLTEQVVGWVEDIITLHEWHHVSLNLNSSMKRLEIWIDGKLRGMRSFVQGVPDAINYLTVHVNGEDTVTDHDIFIGASKGSDSTPTNFFGGYVDSFSFTNQYLNHHLMERMYGDGMISESNYAVGSYTRPTIHLPMGDFATDFQAESLIIQNHWSDSGYPSATAVNCTALLNLKSRSMESQFDVVRMLKNTSDMSEGYFWCKSFAPSEDMVSRKSAPLGIHTGEDSFEFFSSDALTDSSWDFLNDLSSGTLSFTFFADADWFTDPVPGESVSYSLVSLGYNHSQVDRRNGIQIYVTRNSFLKDWSVVAVIVEDSSTTEIPLYGQGNLSFDSWNTVVLSWDFGVEDGETAISMYLNKMTLATKTKGSGVPTDATSLMVSRDYQSRLQLGVSRFIDDSETTLYLNPWYGRVDDFMLSTYGDPSAHHQNVNMISSTQMIEDRKVHYTFGDHHGDSIASNVSLYGEDNRVQNTLDPGFVGKIKNDIHRVFVGDNTGSRIIFEDGFSGSLIPVPRSVPSNWGTYYWSEEQDDWKTAYPDQIDYGFIHIKPADVGTTERGRWVSVVSYTAWTAYLFGEAESLLLENGYRSSITEGDVALFTGTGRVVPGSVIEQWVNPNLFPGNKPAPDSNGFKGQRCYDGYYMYECVATNTWIRYLTEAFW